MEHYPAVSYILTDRAIKTLLHTHKHIFDDDLFS